MSLASIFKIQLCKVKLFINTYSSLQPFLGKHLLKLESIMYFGFISLCLLFTYYKMTGFDMCT